MISETPEMKGETHLEVLVDENMVEVFANNGEYVITNAVYHLGRYVTSSVSKAIQLYTTEEE